MTHAGIECFLAVCRYKTGSRAAHSLFITQSSLSTRLKTLEQELGGNFVLPQARQPGDDPYCSGPGIL